MLRTVTAMQAGGVVTLAWRPIAKPDVGAWAELLAAAGEGGPNGENHAAGDLAAEGGASFTGVPVTMDQGWTAR